MPFLLSNKQRQSTEGTKQSCSNHYCYYYYEVGVFVLTEESAECEPAWQGAGQAVGLQIWRIVVSSQLVVLRRRSEMTIGHTF